MKVISVVGLQHCGSTLLFNLISFILRKKNKTFKTICFNKQRDFRRIPPKYDYLLVKSHVFIPKLQKISNIIFIPKRDIRDSLITHMKRKKFGFRRALRHYKNTSLKYYWQWIKHKHFKFKYEGYMKNKKTNIERIINIIGFEFDNKQKIINELLIECNNLKKNLVKKNGKFVKSNYKKTFMTKSHSTSGGKIKKYLKEFNRKQRRILINDIKFIN